MDFFIGILVLGILYAVVTMLKGRSRAKDTSPEKDTAELYAIAGQLNRDSEQAAHPRDLFQYPAFMRGVQHFNRGGYSTNDLDKILQELGENLTGAMVAELQDWRGTQVDINFLKSFGRVWEASGEDKDEVVIRHDQLLNHVSTLEATLLEEPPRSMILVAEPGVGKSSILQVLANHMLGKGWIIFEAGGIDLIS